MTFISVLFLILELVILAVGILIGYRRGIGRSMMRLAYLAIIGIVSFILGRLIAFRVSDSVMLVLHDLLPADVQAILATTPELEVVIASLMGALIAPLVFALLFGILQLLSLIFFKMLSGKLVSAIYKNQEAPAWSKWAGAGVGLVSSVAIAAVLLSPLFTVMYVVENTPDETLTIFAEALGGEDDGESVVAMAPNGAMKASVTALSPALDTLDTPFDMTHLTPWKTFLIKALTEYEIPTGNADTPTHHESASDSLPALMEAAGDALYAYNQTATNGGTSVDAFTNAAAALIPYIEQSPTIKQVAADALSAMGQTLQNGGAIMGMELPKTENELIKSMVDSLVNTLAQTTPDTVESNMKSLFGELDDSLKPESKRTKPENKPSVPEETDPVEIETKTETKTAIETEALTETNVAVTESDVTANTEKTESSASSTTESAASTETDVKTTETVGTETKVETETKAETETKNETKAETEAVKPTEQPTAPADTTSVANKGLLSALSKLDRENPLDSLKDESTSEIFKEAFGGVANNPEMAGLISEIRAYAMTLIQKSNIDIMNEKYQPMYELVCSELESVLSDCLTSGMTSSKEVAGVIEERLMAQFEQYEFPVESYQVALVAQCAAVEFLGDKYVDGTSVSISVEDILSFFGLSESEMPEWVG